MSINDQLNDLNIPFASKVVVSLIDSPLHTEITSNEINNLFKVYFDLPRIFKLNDRIFLKSNLAADVEYQFKIIDVEPETMKNDRFRIDIEHTTLSQTEASIKDNWIWTKPVQINCLNNYVDAIVNIISFHKNYKQTNEDSLPIILLYGSNGCGKTRVIESVCSKLSLHLCKINGVLLAGETASAIEKRVEIFIQNSLNYGPCIIYIKSFHFVFKFRDLNECNKRMANTFFNIISRFYLKYLSQKKQNASENDKNWFFIACGAETKEQLDANVLSNFNLELEIKTLNSTERKQAICDDVYFNKKLLKLDRDASIENFVKKTNGLLFSELKTLTDIIKQEYELCNKDSTLSFKEIFETSLHKFEENRKFKQENRLNIENINWNDIGGLTEIKKIIMDTILLPLNYPNLFTSSKDRLGISRSGILLYGPPGTGKTLLAKAICCQCELNFLSVKGPELLDMYVGQTELNVRNLFQKARMNAPCVLFFDELDSLAPIRGRAGDSGGVMDRVVSQLLTEIDGLDKHISSDDAKSNQIFLIGATNRPDLIDPSLLRPGRFDKLVYVPVAKTKNERVNIFNALTRKLKLDSKFNVNDFIDQCPKNLTGADFFAITNRARQNALKRIINAIEAENKSINEYNKEIFINEYDFYQVLDNFVPTLNDTTLLDYEKYFIKYSQNS